MIVADAAADTRPGAAVLASAGAGLLQQAQEDPKNDHQPVHDPPTSVHERASTEGHPQSNEIRIPAKKQTEGGRHEGPRASPDNLRQEGLKVHSEGDASDGADLQAGGDRCRDSDVDLWSAERLTGDWAGVRSWLQEEGITFEVSLVSIYQQNVRGGWDTSQAGMITGSVDYQLTFDLHRLGVWEAAVLYVHAEGGWNTGIDDRVGSLGGVNGDAIGDEVIFLRELWWEQKFLEDKVRVRMGKLDASLDFDTNAFANDEVTQFLSGPLINTANLPFPEYGLGVQVMVEPVEWFYGGVLAADAQAGGRETGFRTAFHGEDYFFGVGELGFRPVWHTSWGELPGGYRIGLWYDPQPRPRFYNDLGGRRRTVPMRRDDTGMYVSMDQRVLPERPDFAGDTQGLGVFFRYGYAPQETSVIEHFWSLGALYQGLLPGRDDDVLAFGFAQSILSDTLVALEGGDRESVYECYYACRVFPWLTVSPDIQYIRHPGGTKTRREAVVAGVRVLMSF